MSSPSSPTCERNSRSKGSSADRRGRGGGFSTSMTSAHDQRARRDVHLHAGVFDPAATPPPLIKDAKSDRNYLTRARAASTSAVSSSDASRSLSSRHFRKASTNPPPATAPATIGRIQTSAVMPSLGGV